MEDKTMLVNCDGTTADGKACGGVVALDGMTGKRGPSFCAVCMGTAKCSSCGGRLYEGYIYPQVDGGRYCGGCETLREANTPCSHCNGTMGAHIDCPSQDAPLTVGDLKRGDVFRYTESLDGVEGETETLHVVLSPSKDNVDASGEWHTPAEVSALGQKMFFSCIMRVKPDLKVQKMHDAAEVEEAARLLGLTPKA